MIWHAGERVQHRLHPEWGPGEVLSTEGDNVRIAFVLKGVRVFKATAPLDRLAGAEGPRAPASPASSEPPRASRSPAAVTHTVKSAMVARGRFPRRGGAFGLESTRGERADVHGPCSRCDQYTRPLWYYARSTHGAVYLCVPCKEAGLAAREEPSGRDALALPPRLLLTGAFESGRRRH